MMSTACLISTMCFPITQTSFATFKNITSTIERFEPRLLNVEVHYREDHHNPLQLGFGIRGEVSHNGGKVPMSIDVYMGTDGQFNV